MDYSVLTGDNRAFLEELYQSFSENDGILDANWRSLFSNLNNGSKQDEKPQDTLSLTSGAALPKGETIRNMALLALLDAYRKTGHLAASLDPLNLTPLNREAIDRLIQNFDGEDYKISFDSFISGASKNTLNQIISWFERAYCLSTGYEHFYLVDENERNWLSARIESPANLQHLSTWVKLRIFEKLYQAEYLERFLAKKYTGKKRFSLEGAESLIPLLDVIVETAGFIQMEGVTIGMAHRGRLNVLVNIMRKHPSLLFAEFEENFNPETIDYTDVKYHLGYSGSVMTEAKKEVKISLGFNPSHLEASNPVITGQVRARQDWAGDKTGQKYMGILIHGDAAFVGQGVVAETLNLMNLSGYSTGGTLHIVLNNQIGFTANPEESRSTLYATDLAKGFQIPIIHVNADDPEAVYRAARLAMLYRNKFHKDVIIDLIGYRRFGHNEIDEPSFTQPVLYGHIKKHPTAVEIYEKKLLSDKDISADDIQFIKKGVENSLQSTFESAHRENIRMKVDTMGERWASFSIKPDKKEPETKLSKQEIELLSDKITTYPKDFTPHTKIIKLLENRRNMGKGKENIDWGFSEALAFASLLKDKIRIRMSGQDAQRGTFSHRQAVINDINTGLRYNPLNHISSEQAQIEIINSPLSEYAVLGFEYGYSVSYPESLVIWEAQFGDFINGAQIIIDQFISSAEYKWYRLSGLVLYLPHGYEGQGPEHSSARIERFLELCAENNMRVYNLTESAQLFHALRRQTLFKNKKPLVIFTPKSLLRLPEALSPLEKFTDSNFAEIIEDKWQKDAKKITKLLLCSGKVYYDLSNYFKENKDKITDTACIRIEQLFPFPEEKLKKIVSQYASLKKLIWVQEEPENMGAWHFMQNRLKNLLKDGVELNLAARKASPSPAAGLMVYHKKELDEIFRTVFS